MSGDAVIEADRLTRSFGAVEAVKDLSLRVEAGSVYIMGWINQLRCCYEAQTGPNSNTVAKLLITRCVSGNVATPRQAPGFQFKVDANCSKAANFPPAPGQ
jgi:hypothetical protein